MTNKPTERYPHELRVWFDGDKPTKATIEGVEFAPVAQEPDDDAEHLRRILRVVRPYISDKAGAGIIDAVNEAIATRLQAKNT